MSDPRPAGFGATFDATAGQATRERRQQLGQLMLHGLHALQRNARTHAPDNAVFDVTLTQLATAAREILACDGMLELRAAHDGFYLNRQLLQGTAQTLSIVTAVAAELAARGVQALRCPAEPPPEDWRALTYVFVPGAAALGPRGVPDRPMTVLVLDVQHVAGADAGGPRGLEQRLSDAYGHAVFFVGRYIELLQRGGDVLPIWAASRSAMELVDLQQEAPLRFLLATRTRTPNADYLGYHAANVAMLCVSFGAYLRMPKRRRHDLAMAALFHDVGIAAVPAEVVSKEGAFDLRERNAMDLAPLFAARAVLRERDVHAAALGRATAVYECHLRASAFTQGQAPPSLYARVLRLCEAFDAMTSARPHRAALSVHEALAELSRSAQVQGFDTTLLMHLPRAFAPIFA